MQGKFFQMRAFSDCTPTISLKLNGVVTMRMNGGNKSVILIVLLAGLCVGPFLVPAPSASAEVTALDMLIEAEG